MEKFKNEVRHNFHSRSLIKYLVLTYPKISAGIFIVGNFYLWYKTMGLIIAAEGENNAKTVALHSNQNLHINNKFIVYDSNSSTKS